jgi:glutathione peroxidase
MEEEPMSLYDVPVAALDGAEGQLAQQKGNVTLVVNVASQCGLTPQYGGLQHLYEQFGDKGFAVLGFPCNQFGQQEPGTPDEIGQFCETNYGVTFPMFEKIEVNGEGQHPLYEQLTKTADAEGHSGDIRWNFEKFLVSRQGEVLARFSPMVEPEAPELVSAVEKALAE